MSCYFLWLDTQQNCTSSGKDPTRKSTREMQLATSFEIFSKQSVKILQVFCKQFKPDFCLSMCFGYYYCDWQHFRQAADDVPDELGHKAVSPNHSSIISLSLISHEIGNVELLISFLCYEARSMAVFHYLFFYLEAADVHTKWRLSNVWVSISSDFPIYL